METDMTLDTSGLMCPEPVMLLHKAIRSAKGGQIVEVIATDPSTQRDIPKFCHYLGHTLLDQHTADNQQFRYWVKKNPVINHPQRAVRLPQLHQDLLT